MIPDLIHLEPGSIPSVVGEIPIKGVDPGFSIEIKIDIRSLTDNADHIECVALTPEKTHGNQKTKREKEKRA